MNQKHRRLESQKTYLLQAAAILLAFILSPAACWPKDESKLLTFQSKLGYSFKYHSCWKVSGETDDPTLSENIGIYFTEKCLKDERGTWSIGIDRIGSDVSNEKWVSNFLNKKSDRLIAKKDIKINHVNAVLWETLTDETEKLIDRIDQTNFGWSVKLFCGKTNFSFSYSDHLDKKNRDEVRKSHEPPAIFKEFIEGFRCENKK